MKIIWITPLLLIQSYRTIGLHLQDEYNQYSFYQKRPLSPRPLDTMADLTNDLGICVLRVIAAGGAIGNIAFSPFGLMAVSVLLYEGSSGYSALQIKQSLNLPWEILAVRIGVRDLNRYLKTYFKSDGFLNGLTMSREEVCLRPQFKRVLRLYGFDDPNSFLFDSCPDSATTTMQPLQPMSVTTHGTVVTEMTPTSQIIQVSTNITNSSANNTSTVATEVPAKVTYVGDASFTISNIDTNTNLPMNSQTVTMVVDIDTQPHTMPLEFSTNQAMTTVLINEQEPKSSNEIKMTNTRPNELLTTKELIVNTTPITSDDPMTAEATVTQTNIDFKSGEFNSSINKIVDTTNNSKSQIAPTDIFTTTWSQHESTTDDLSYITIANNGIVSPSNSYVTRAKDNPDITIIASTEIPFKTTADNELNGIYTTMEDKYSFLGKTVEAIMTTNNELRIDTEETTKSMDVESTSQMMSSTNPISNDDGTTTEIETNTVIKEITDQTYTNAKLNNDQVTTVSDNLVSSTDIPLTMVSSSNATENEIIREAESNQHYQIAALEKKSARSMESNSNLPTFNVEFVVRKEDMRNNCNNTRKRTIIKPDRILTEYPSNSGVSITLRESKKRRRRHLNQYQAFNTNRNQWFNGYKTYGPPSGWMDRSSNPFESINLFNAGYQRIPFFTYTAVLPFGFIFELKSQVIEIPLDDPKYTLMILMPNHPNGLSELLLLLPSMSLRNIHNSLKPTAVHATVPTFKYTAKVDLTSALQQIGIHDVFYRYRADLSFMSPDARLFVSSVQQVVSVTVKKYNTPPVYEIQRKYVEQEFVVSKPFVYFVMDIHTKVSLIAGVITDPLASPIWI
uniref:Leukocyte elastase inhibitor C n=1 Tax=Schizaphis graminum TaxID=13262 RepID=A0A2S2NX58_SCHGA